jgi:hypothetical protein
MLNIILTQDSQNFKVGIILVLFHIRGQRVHRLEYVEALPRIRNPPTTNRPTVAYLRHVKHFSTEPVAKSSNRRNIELHNLWQFPFPRILNFPRIFSTE